MAKEDPEWGGFLQATFLAVLESADEGLVVFDGDGRCRMIGRRAGEIFGLEPAAYVGHLRDEVLAAFARACEEPDALLEVVADDAPLAGPSPVAEVDVRRPRPRTVLCKGVRVRAGREAARVAHSVRDVTRERAAERSGPAAPGAHRRADRLRRPDRPPQLAALSRGARARARPEHARLGQLRRPAPRRRRDGRHQRRVRRPWATRCSSDRGPPQEAACASTTCSPG